MLGYTTLASNVRERPSFVVAEEVARQDYPMKLPSWAHLQFSSTPEISQFRGYQDDLDESKKGRATIRHEQREIGVAARCARTQVLPYMDIGR